MSSLANFVRVAIDQDTCISCGACIEVCPYDALEFDENMKARLIWEKCQDDFSCIESCPVNCIYKVEEAPEELKTEKAGWYRLGRELNEEEKKAFEEWRQKYGVKVDPVQA
ncbi:ferredoxin [Aeropyrum pernix K1]|uniref:Ferredoxin n=2 Tax=Aeropyrum pernix TaxID=56636 RepID=Q9YFC1_AERPE|nr:ferredoxin family protein [Aeropyrum pernix]BAA79275.2 ferredoxin [Aeropyrum pernix K1]GBF09798.1 ferredoxin [Aeropyrum pernix]